MPESPAYTLDDLAAIRSVLTPAELKELDALLEWTPPDVCLRDLKIRTKGRDLVSLGENLKPIQKKFLDDNVPGWTIDKPIDLRGCRCAILKARQEGVSTLVDALIFADTCNNPRTYSLILAHEADATERLFQMMHRFYENLPPHKRPKRKYSSKKEILFGELDSGLYVGTAGQGSVGRSGTWQNIHKSEYAKWKPNGTTIGEIDAGLDDAVPASGNVFHESTANGLDHFYEMWIDISKPGYQGLMKPLFYAWFQDPDYSTPPLVDFVRTPEEIKMANAVYDFYQFTLSDGQLYWYRQKAAERKGLMKQEYPTFPLEAFIASGNAYYDREYLTDLLNRLQLEEPLYIVESGEQGFHCPFTVWKEPDPSKNYVCAIDPAGGPDKNNDSDCTSMHVFDVETWEEHLTYHGRVDPWFAGSDVGAIAAWYNDARVGVLRLMHGFEVIRALIEGGHTDIWADEDEDHGIIENTKTKPQMDDSLGAIFADMSRGEPGLILHSSETVQECITYAHLPGGKAGAEGTAHDDRQASLKACVKLLRTDDRRYKIPQKEPPPAGNVYGGHWKRRGL